MKKIITFLCAALIITSCCNSNDNSQSKHDKPLQTIKLGLEYNVTKTTIEKHTYIVVSGPYKLEIEHDPECPYCKEKHKIEITDF